MAIRVSPRKRTVRFDALPAVHGTKPGRRKQLPKPSVPLERQVSDVKVYNAATGELLRTEAPYPLYALNDPRRRRGLDAVVHGNVNMTYPRRTGPDNGRQPAVEPRDH